MCELFAMSAKAPSTVSLSLEEFSKHGGLTGHHKDGWGVAWYDEGDLHLRKEPFAAAHSDAMQTMLTNSFKCTVALSHIRKATQGEIATRNCQPFIRELGGKWHAFIHNGNLADIRNVMRFKGSCFQSVGETDSEYAFCALLTRLKEIWSPSRTPPLNERLTIIQLFAAELRQTGPANFLYSDGDAVFAHGHKRIQSDGHISAPGLWRLQRHCKEGGIYSGQGLSIEAKGVDQDVVLFASVPLSPESWTPMVEGEVLVTRNGNLVPPSGLT